MLGIINKIKKYKKEIGINRSSGFPVKYYNWWQSNSHPKDFWFSKFILSRQIMQAYPDKNIAFFSCFGIRIFMSIIPADVKIFYTGENTEDGVMGFSRFNDYGLNNNLSSV
ncbi:MAG: hypothetical protein LBG77_08005 [Dysgonamonadaceae bacterium]|jgi:hypothetical protein|nr:hypothetical protein [Dysgonamonadaceae bacterium]